jgi:hypothetical protein
VVVDMHDVKLILVGEKRRVPVRSEAGHTTGRKTFPLDPSFLGVETRKG